MSQTPSNHLLGRSRQWEEEAGRPRNLDSTRTAPDPAALSGKTELRTEKEGLVSKISDKPARPRVPFLSNGEYRKVRIIHPTDFSPDSELAFQYALRLTLQSQGRLEIIHVDTGVPYSSWLEFPHVRVQLARWGLLPGDAPPEAIHRLGLSVERIRVSWHNPAAALEEYVHHHPTDLIVMATHQREGLRRWLSGSVPEELMRRAHVPTLIVPDQTTSGFLDPATGKLALHNMLLPIDYNPPPALVLQAALRFATWLDSSAAHMRVLHVGRSMPSLKMTDIQPWHAEISLGSGDAAEEIIAMTHRQPAELVVMATEEHQNLRNWLWGSTVQRVSRFLRCPLLVVPASTATWHLSPRPALTAAATSIF